MVVRKILLQGGPQILRQLGVVVVDKAVVGLHPLGQLLLLGRQIGAQVLRNGPQVKRGEGRPLRRLHERGVQFLQKLVYSRDLKPVERAVQLHPLAAGIAVQQALLGLGGIEQGAVGNAPGPQLIGGGAAEKPGGLQKAVGHKLQGGAVHAVPHQAVGDVHAPGVGGRVFHGQSVLRGAGGVKFLGKPV